MFSDDKFSLFLTASLGEYTLEAFKKAALSIFPSVQAIRPQHTGGGPTGPTPDTAHQGSGLGPCPTAPSGYGAPQLSPDALPHERAGEPRTAAREPQHAFPPRASPSPAPAGPDGCSTGGSGQATARHRSLSPSRPPSAPSPPPAPAQKSLRLISSFHKGFCATPPKAAIGHPPAPAQKPLRFINSFQKDFCANSPRPP